jgi:hypothetical protein
MYKSRPFASIQTISYSGANCLHFLFRSREMDPVDSIWPLNSRFIRNDLTPKDPAFQFVYVG